MLTHEPPKKSRPQSKSTSGRNRHVKKRARAKTGAWIGTLLFTAAAAAAAFFVGSQYAKGKIALPAVFRSLGKQAKKVDPLPAVPAPVPDPAHVDPVVDPGVADLPNPNVPISVRSVTAARVPMVLIQGGLPGTRRSPIRAGVDQIVAVSGAKAGLNGTFFANASLNGTDNLLIGPSLCGDEANFVFSPFDKHTELTGRPMVLMSRDRTRIYPYDPDTMDDEAGLRSRLPGLTDAFLGGVWLVHDGAAIDKAHEDDYHIHDAEDPRRRAFFFITKDGQPGLGATTYVVKSSQIGRALESLGMQEAVLLDSGFSTSLVCGSQILVTGHTSPGIPSRPVPHAILLFAQDSPTLPADVEPARVADADTPHHRTGHARRRHI